MRIKISLPESVNLSSFEGPAEGGAASHRYEEVFSCIVKGLSPYKGITIQGKCGQSLSTR